MYSVILRYLINHKKSILHVLFILKYIQ